MDRNSKATLFGRIAYAGRVGKERERWCKDYITLKTKQLGNIETDQVRHASEINKQISCSKGCSYCCSQHIGVSLQDGDAIVYWLHLHQDIRDGFMDRYPAWRESLRRHEAVYQQVNEAVAASIVNPNDPSTIKELTQKAKSYQELNVLCPFLDQEICSIYPVRPFVCATYVVVSPPDQCKASSIKAPEQLSSVCQPTAPPYFYGSEDALILSSLPLLLYEIIKVGFIYLNDIPGLDGLEKEVFSDPEIQKLMR